MERGERGRERERACVCVCVHSGFTWLTTECKEARTKDKERKERKEMKREGEEEF
jgi:hypothetical protein